MRAPGVDRPIEVEDRFEKGRLDQDEGGRIGRGLGRLGDHERDRLAGPQDLAPGERLVEHGPCPSLTIGRSAAVRTATTPGTASAAEASIRSIRA